MSNVIYELVNCDGLAASLAEDALMEEVRKEGLEECDLYDLSGGDTGNRLVKDEWAHKFFALKEGYSSLINEHKKQ